MEFTYQELARLNQMIGIALMSGRVEFDEVSESVHKKVAQEICNQAKADKPPADREQETEKEVS